MLTSMPMPAGLEMASEISLVSSSWLRTSSIVASTLSTFLQRAREEVGGG